MAKSKRLIVGLGNPGPQYENTRHNIGFMVADAVAEFAGITYKHERGNVLLGWGRIRSYPVGVAKPLAFMNRSGSSVRNLLLRYRLELQDMLVVVDDINLPTGKLRLRARGSAGGHNGMQDIIDHLGSDDFPRLRIGIGSEFERGKQADYVLSPFAQDELPVVDEAIVRARDAVVTYVTEGIETAMNRFN